MLLYIPTIGTRLVLSRPWTFELHGESRNFVMASELGLRLSDGRMYLDMDTNKWVRTPAQSSPVTLPVDTELSVDRIYIRRGLKGFDSITFRLITTSHPKLAGKKSLRFWAKLADVNTMEVANFPDVAPAA